MATETAYPGDDPRQLLSGTRELTQRFRRAQRATWFRSWSSRGGLRFYPRVPLRRRRSSSQCVVTGPGSEVRGLPQRDSCTGLPPWRWPTWSSRPSTSAGPGPGASRSGWAVRHRRLSTGGAHRRHGVGPEPSFGWLENRPVQPGHAADHPHLRCRPRAAGAGRAERNRALLLLTVSPGGGAGPSTRLGPGSALTLVRVPRLVTDGSLLLLGGIGLPWPSDPGGLGHEQPSCSGSTTSSTAGAARHPHHRPRGRRVEFRELRTT